MRIFLLVLTAACAIAAGPNPCISDPSAHAALQAANQSSEKRSIAEKRKTLDELAAKYPADLDIQTQRIWLYKQNQPDEWPAVRDAYVKRAEENPSDPAALMLAGTVLYTRQTPRAIEFMTKARSAPGGFPLAALKLAGIYESGKFEDKDKARENLSIYVSACGEYASRSADRAITKLADQPMQAAIARRLRARLEKESHPDAEDYEYLWSLEFRSRPPAEHPGLRKQVAKDVERLTALKPDKRSFDSILAGLKQSGASKETITAFENRILKEAPSSDTAYTITYERWKKEHKEPSDHKDTAAWQAWKKAHLDATKKWAAQFTDVSWLEDNYLEERIDAGELKEAEVVPLIEKAVDRDVLRDGPDFWTYVNGAGALLRNNWAPERAYAWTQQAWLLAERQDLERLEDDTLTAERRKEIAEGGGLRGNIADDYAWVSKLAGKQPPPSLRAYVEGPLPVKKGDLSSRYRALAWLAMIDGRTPDALAYFQQALFTREEEPKYFRGKLEDTLRDEAKAAFVKAGGSEKAFAIWSQPSSKSPELAEGRWEKPTKTLPAFELSDLNGTTWKLTQLEGKAVLINLWATWCGPCKSELPHLQKLYEQTKGRSDIQVISFNVDEDLGLVEPFLKEQGYNFPALMGYSLIRGMFDGYGIPQNWLVDPKGKWVATQIGYDSSDTDWEGSMLKRLEAVKQGKPPAGLE